MKPIQQTNFDKLIDNVYQTHCLLQQTAQKAVNHFLVIKNWMTGFYIIEYEQQGEDRAKYGERLIDEMSKKLRNKGLKGYSPMSLRNCRAFYKTYPQIQQTVSVKLQNMGIGLILCGDKSETLAKYATSGMDNQLFVFKFLVKLPEKKMLEEFIQRELNNNG